jgi:uncharacterized YigZ family protein
LSPDERLVPAREGRFELRERASRFLGIAVPCASAARANDRLARWRREFHDATHVAFAWRIGTGSALVERSSDAGEPSGTAGKPIVLAIHSAAVTDVLVAVVRWYGGTKLGTGGLARAYRSAAEGALAEAGSRTVADTGIVAVSCPWERMGDLRRLVRPPEVTVASEKFEEASAIVRLAVFRSRLPALTAALDEARLSYSVEDGRGGGGAESGTPG